MQNSEERNSTAYTSQLIAYTFHGMNFQTVIFNDCIRPSFNSK